MSWDNLNPRVTFAIYSVETGRIRCVTTCEAFFVRQQMRAGEGFLVLEGDADPGRSIVRGGELVARPEDELLAEDTARAMVQLRASRDSKLKSEIDSLNALRVSSMSKVEISAWQLYRQKLLDFPDTVEDVFSPIWPEAPAS